MRRMGNRIRTTTGTLRGDLDLVRQRLEDGQPASATLLLTHVVGRTLAYIHREDPNAWDGSDWNGYDEGLYLDPEGDDVP